MKNETISKILELTGREGNMAAFDKLSDQTEPYLKKYLKVVEGLKKSNAV